MPKYALTQLDDRALLELLKDHITRDRAHIVELIASIGEVEKRELYRPAGYSSMYAFCVGAFHMSEDAALKRIRVARAAQEHPAIFEALAEGRLNVSGVLLLARHLTPGLAPDTAHELLRAAARKTNAEIELLLAERFPKPDLPTLIREIPAQVAACEVAVRPVDAPAEQLSELAVRPVGMTLAQQMPAPALHSRLTPLSPGRVALQMTVDQETRELLRRALALAAHSVPAGDLAAVLKQALAEFVERRERRKFGTCANPRPRGSAANGRYVPAEIRREVWKRDGGRCTFVGDQGHRCEERTRLEFDHEQPVARGGRTTIENLRLRCRAHNQYAAECTYGAGFMQRKREQAREAALSREAAMAREAALAEKAAEVVPWLRELGSRPAVSSHALPIGIHTSNPPVPVRPSNSGP